MGFLDFFSRLRKKHCAGCGQVAIHGYSRAAESCAKDITPLCVSCLDSQAPLDYRDFGGRPVLIAPAVGVPCYVCGDRESLRSISPESPALCWRRQHPTGVGNPQPFLCAGFVLPEELQSVLGASGCPTARSASPQGTERGSAAHGVLSRGPSNCSVDLDGAAPLGVAATPRRYVSACVEEGRTHPESRGSAFLDCPGPILLDRRILPLRSGPARRRGCPHTCGAAARFPARAGSLENPEGTCCPRSPGNRCRFRW